MRGFYFGAKNVSDRPLSIALFRAYIVRGNYLSSLPIDYPQLPKMYANVPLFVLPRSLHFGKRQSTLLATEKYCRDFSENWSVKTPFPWLPYERTFSRNIKVWWKNRKSTLPNGNSRGYIMEGFISVPYRWPLLCMGKVVKYEGKMWGTVGV